MPDEPVTTQPQQEGAPSQPAPEAASQDQEGAQFQKWYESRVKPEMEKRDTELHSLRTGYGRLEAQLKKAREWTDEDIASFSKAYGTYEGSKKSWEKRGVPEWLLDSAHPARLDEAAEKYLAERGTTTKPVAGDAQYAQFLEWQKTQNGTQPKRGAADEVLVPSGGGAAPRVQVTHDNIDTLYLEGKVSGEKYRRFLSTGEL